MSGLELREPDTRFNGPRRPSRDPEIDEPGADEGLLPPGTPGIDDGFLSPEPGSPRRPASPNPPRSFPLPPSTPVPDVPPHNGFFMGGDGASFYPRRPIDVNVYATKKTVAQGMMDLALLSANANQLRYVLESGDTHQYYYFSITLISISIILQIVVGVGLIVIGRYNIKRENEIPKADRINNAVVMAIFLITVVNVFISAFGIDEAKPILVDQAMLQ